MDFSRRRRSLHQKLCELLWKLARASTCPVLQFKRMEFEKIGVLPIDNDKLRRTFPDMRPENLILAGDGAINGGNNYFFVRAFVIPRPLLLESLQKEQQTCKVRQIKEIRVSTVWA